MEERSPSGKIKVTSWKEFIEKLTTPARSPQFPELMSTGQWKPWNADPTPQDTPTTIVEQPRRIPSRVRRLFSNNRQYRPPLQLTPLPEGHIRLLDLRDAITHDNILVGFKLIDVPLANAPRYEAISYCWGSTDLCTGILISTRFGKKQVYRITENLAACLHSLMVSEQPVSDRPRYIWVDQICINQEDVHERNAQVRRMADVYKSATRVIVWLGQVSSLNPDELDLDIPAESHLMWNERLVSDWIVEWAIFSRAWFFRLWVFQEAVFAQRISLLLGATFISWESLLKRHYSLLEFNIDILKGKLTFSHFFLNHLRYLVIGQIIDTAEALADKTAIDLAYLMWKLDKQECQDPRDKVFSLVGFAGDILPPSFVDYDLPVAVMVQDCTRRLIANSGSLRAITYLNRETPKRRPSWVPRWHEELKLGLGPELLGVSASLNRKWKPTSPVVENQLIVAGKQVDTIADEVHTFCDLMGEFFVDDRFSDNRFASVLRYPFFEAWARRGRVLESQDQSKPAAAEIPSLGQTSAAVQTPESSSEALLEFFVHFFRALFLGKDTEEGDFENLIQGSTASAALSRLQDLLDWGIHRSGTLLVLSSGRLGFVETRHQEPKIGDPVVILHGHDIPCVLHKSEDGQGWLYVTEIYIHDIMRGEAVDWEEDEADTFTLV